MYRPTDEEKARALAHVLDCLGNVCLMAQGNKEDPRKTTGVLIIEFKDDGDYHTHHGGYLNKGTVLGALFDSAISYREQSNIRQAGELFEALYESAGIPDDEKQ